MTPDLEQLISDLMYDDEYLEYHEALEKATKILEDYECGTR